MLTCTSILYVPNHVNKLYAHVLHLLPKHASSLATLMTGSTGCQWPASSPYHMHRTEHCSHKPTCQPRAMTTAQSNPNMSAYTTAPQWPINYIISLVLYKHSEHVWLCQIHLDSQQPPSQFVTHTNNYKHLSFTSWTGHHWPGFAWHTHGWRR